jgi:excisionase family DNA binding protein
MGRRVTVVILGQGVVIPKGEIGDSFPKLLTAQEVADQLDVSLRTVRRLIAQKKLAIVHIGAAVRIKPETVAAFIDEQ